MLGPRNQFSYHQSAPETKVKAGEKQNLRSFYPAAEPDSCSRDNGELVMVLGSSMLHSQVSSLVVWGPFTETGKFISRY